MSPEQEMRERLAALEHQQWTHWARHMLEVLNPLLQMAAFSPLRLAGSDKAREALERWKRQINTPYADLSEKEKDSDREWADRVLEITGTASPLNGAYSERAQCVAALVRLALRMGLRAGTIPATKDEWSCAYIDTPEGQIAWHIAEADLHHFDGIPKFTGDTSQTYTTAEKYRRLAEWADKVFAALRDER